MQMTADVTKLTDYIAKFNTALCWQYLSSYFLFAIATKLEWKYCFVAFA